MTNYVAFLKSHAYEWTQIQKILHESEMYYILYMHYVVDLSTQLLHWHFMLALECFDQLIIYYEHSSWGAGAELRCNKMPLFTENSTLSTNANGSAQ